MVYLLRGLTLGFSAGAMPGPFQAYLLAQALKNGWQRTLPAALAPLLGDAPIILLVVLVLAQTPAWLLRLLQVAGGFFILYLAYGAYQAFRSAGTRQAPAADSARQTFLKAVLVNLLSPGPYLFWSLVNGPILMEGWRQSPALGLSFIVGFYSSFVGLVAVLVLLFATARHAGPAMQRLLSGISALALLLFGLYQVWSGLAV